MDFSKITMTGDDVTKILSMKGGDMATLAKEYTPDELLNIYKEATWLQVDRSPEDTTDIANAFGVGGQNIDFVLEVVKSNVALALAAQGIKPPESLMTNLKQIWSTPAGLGLSIGGVALLGFSIWAIWKYKIIKF